MIGRKRVKRFFVGGLLISTLAVLGACGGQSEQVYPQQVQNDYQQQQLQQQQMQNVPQQDPMMNQMAADTYDQSVRNSVRQSEMEMQQSNDVHEAIQDSDEALYGDGY